MLSVIIPVYNAEKFIRKALQNVIEQAMDNIEIIVIDDGSTDQSADVIQREFPMVKYIYQLNQGASKARNTGIEAATGKYIAFLDVDDQWPLGKLKRQLAFLESNADTALIWDMVDLVFDNGHVEKQNWADRNTQKLPLMCLGAGLFRKSVFDEVGLFDINLNIGEDWDWYNRAVEKGIKIERTQNVGLLYLRHDTNLTKDLAKLNQQTVFLLKHTLDRRRQNQSSI
ncbi:MAG: glycosyltransferase family 2 protein [Spirosomaceae bacterium]|jgi:glycosyltransferase involved in cell wall biosynthesis|nr:glycosyltransferase family 2 protein [Spirosomataceae bacterium]